MMPYPAYWFTEEKRHWTSDRPVKVMPMVERSEKDLARLVVSGY